MRTIEIRNFRHSTKAWLVLFFPALCFLQNAGSSSIAEDPRDREKLNAIADAMEANVIVPSIGHVRNILTRSEAGVETKLIDEFICDGTFRLNRSGDLNGDGGEITDVAWSFVQLSNPRYFAAITRKQPTRDPWQLRLFSKRGDGLYEKIMQEPWNLRHPSADYLRVPPVLAPDYFRTAEILGRSEPETVDRFRAETWTLSFTPPEGSRLDRKFVITESPPYRLLEQSYVIDGQVYQSDLVHYSSWNSDGGGVYPTVEKVTFRNKRNGPPITYVGKVSFTESMAGFNEEEAYLSFYGLPEPGDEGMSRLMTGAIIGMALLVLVATYVYRKRRA